MSDYKVVIPRNPLADGTRQYEFLTDAEFHQVSELLKADPEIMAAIYRQAEKINRNREIEEPDDEIPVAGYLPEIAAVIHGVTSRDTSSVFAFAVVAEFLEEEKLIEKIRG
ncbi:hypothetical protein X760_26770 [Mesorhizobium sp. LSHC422A00]|uniref:hypothetical protein n=1 Tax=unclassified Mesorhizobium TaxID=325217 RepID=UPI0003CF69E6|nr:hypothetical protein [Mesorhizobium sp. LSHC422A00]ESX54706.1 hypothetical protein X760_26770 [Mesorhizobium sp. LSHC422A00]